MKLFWVLHASDARRWGSVIHIWNSACLRIRLVQLNLDLVNTVQHRDSLKVARVKKCHPGDTLATTLRQVVARVSLDCRQIVTRLSPGCRLVSFTDPLAFESGSVLRRP